MKNHLGYVLGLALTASAASSGRADAMSADTWRHLLEILPDLKDMFDAAPGAIANDLPNLMTADNDLRDQLSRAEKFHVAHDFRELEPKIDGDRLFSKDAGTSRAIRDEYADFVDDEAHDLDLLRRRHAEQFSYLADYQRLLKRNADFANEAPDLIARAATVSENMAQELAGVLLTAEDAKRTASELVEKYQQIVREYDAKIREEEITHAAHVSTLKIIDMIRPKANAGAAQSPGPEAAMPSHPRSETADVRIRGAINLATAAVEVHASQSEMKLSSEQRRMGPTHPNPNQQRFEMPVDQTSPGFKATMTPSWDSH